MKYEAFQDGLLPSYKCDMEGYVWNFAFGANMNPLSMIKRRRLNPVESVPGKIDGVQLTFDIKGLAYFEPAFGNIQFMEGSQIHGVLHKLTLDDFHRLQKTEGGGGVSKMGYYPVLLPATAYDGRQIQAWALKSFPLSEIDNEKLGVLPSKRYLKLLVDGAKHYKLDQDYINYLESLKGQTNNVSHYVVMIILVILLFPLLLFLLIFNLLLRIDCCLNFTRRYINPCLSNIFWGTRNCLPSCLIQSNKEDDLKIPKFYIKR